MKRTVLILTFNLFLLGAAISQEYRKPFIEHFKNLKITEGTLLIKLINNIGSIFNANSEEGLIIQIIDIWGPDELSPPAFVQVVLADFNTDQQWPIILTLDEVKNIIEVINYFLILSSEITEWSHFESYYTTDSGFRLVVGDTQSKRIAFIIMDENDLKSKMSLSRKQLNEFKALFVKSLEYK